MAHDDPFTIDLFGNTALSSGLNLGVTAFGDSFHPDDDDPDPSTLTPASPAVPQMPSGACRARGSNFYLDDHRCLAQGWKERARDNIAAIRLASEIEDAERPATLLEQEKLIRFAGFGATDLANGVFRHPGEVEFRKGWDDIGAALEDAVVEADYASLARCTQYAHFTPEFIVRAIWSGLERLGWRGGRVLEPGVGTGHFPALMPEGLRNLCQVTGIELDPITARIARLLQPSARIITGDFARTELPASFDLTIGNPPFSDRTVRSDRAYRKMGLRLHDYFIARSIDLLKPGGLAAFVTSHGTMDKADRLAREHIARSTDLIAAVRLPEGSFRADAGTDVVVDILFFRKRRSDEVEGDASWLDVDEVRPGQGEEAAIRVNRWFAQHPEFVLGTHATTSGPFGETYTCLPRSVENLEQALAATICLLPEAIYDGEPDFIDFDAECGADDGGVSVPEGAAVREGSFFIASNNALMQMVDGLAETIKVRKGRSSDGAPEKHTRIVRKLIPIRDAVREVLKAQEFGQPWKPAQVKLRIAWSNFVRDFGPVNFTTVFVSEDAETGEVRETHRRPNLQPFLDDPDCWLVASIEDYDLETNTAKPGPIFTERVIAPPSAPIITSAADALAVVLNERGHVDIDHIAELLHVDTDAVICELGDAIFRDPQLGAWQTSDAHLSGQVRDKLKVAEAAAALDPAFERNVRALVEVQPADLRPSDITARLGAPWIPAADVVAFVHETMGAKIKIHHMPELASWIVQARQLGWLAAGTSEWGTERRHAGELIGDALNSRVPQIFDTVRDGESEKRVLNVVDTEAAKEKLTKIKSAFQTWIWAEPDRTDRLARVYNDRFNNIAPRKFNGDHLKLPGASGAFSLYEHQKRGIWRIISAGSTYLAHAVGAGKTMTMAAAIMEQRRLGLIAKAMLVVPGHCLAQAAREFLALYPTARILVADETNFTKDKRHRFLSRAATATWDAIIITHSAFRFIAVPSAFEQQMIHDELELYETLLTKVESDDRVSRKRLERLKEGLQGRLEALATRKDDLLTISEIGIDQIIVDEAQEFRKLSFATNMSTLKGIDPNGSQRAWDLYVKSRFVETKNPGRALVLASGTPITNTLGEMFSVQRYLGYEALSQRGLHEFDAWASTFGDVTTELELQPNGKYKPVTRFATFVNVPELIAMFRSFADVVMPEDLRAYVKIPALSTGTRQIRTSKPSAAFKRYQTILDARIKAIEQREGPPQPGDDILLSVITDGRHAAIDLRLVDGDNDNEQDNKLNDLVGNAFSIWQETSDGSYVRPDGNPHVHIMTTLRPLTEDGFGAKKVAVLDGDGNPQRGKDGKIQYRLWAGDRATLNEIRAAWGQVQNAHLAQHGIDARVDHRSYAAQGIELTPQGKVGIRTRNIVREATAQGREADLDRMALHEDLRRHNAARIARRPEIVIDAVSREKSVFDERDIAKHLHRWIDDGQQFQNLLARIMASPELVLLAGEGVDFETGEVKLSQFATRDMVRIEETMARQAAHLSTHGAFGSQAHVRNEVLASHRQLSDEQRNAIKLATGDERLALIVGRAGAGKTTMMKAAREVWQASGYLVVGGALAGKAAEGLQREAGIESRTLASWALQWEQGRLHLNDKTVFVMDEAGMVSSRQMADLISAAAHAGAKIVLVGDADQLQPIEAGGAFRVLSEQIDFAELSTIYRQREQWMREASMALARGNVSDALAAYQDRGHVIETATKDEAISRMVADWVADYDPNRTTLMVAFMRKDVVALNALAREGLKAKGIIEDGHEFRTANGVRNFAAGDQIVFQQNEGSLGVMNGMIGRVVEAEHGKIAVELGDPRSGRPHSGAGLRRVEVEQHLYAQVDHGYDTRAFGGTGRGRNRRGSPG